MSRSARTGEMPLHVLIDDPDGGRALAFNVDEAWVSARIVGPWEKGDELVVDGRHWKPRAVRVSIYEAPGVPDKMGGIAVWNASVRDHGVDRTNDFLARPSPDRSAIRSDAVAYASDRRKVMVVHGRNAIIRQATFDFLRAIDLRPLEWTELVGAAAAGAPYIGDILDAAFSEAQAVVVVSTPDDLARLRPELVPEADLDDEATVMGQARPNVFFEAGMALGRFPTRTILTEIGELRPASDLAGRHAVRLNDGPECRTDLAQRLERAGCTVNTTGTDWLSAGVFQTPARAGGFDVPSGSVSRLLQRIDALRSDLALEPGMVAWGIATTYNGLLEEAGEEDLPRAEPQGRSGIDELAKRPRRSSMTAAEMTALLGQLRARLA